MNKVKNATKKASSRVDVQVILIVMIFTALSVVITSKNYWELTLEAIMKAETERVYALYDAVESQIDPDTFYEINSPEDMESELYKETMETLLKLKQSSGVMYLYTAKVNDEGDLVYVIDGLEAHLDFRYPNDPIEDDIAFKMKVALTGQEALPLKILNTDWGDIFMAYMPFHDEFGNVIGVVGIEFDASDIYSTYQQLQTNTIYNGIILIILAAFVSVWLFRRITNPLYIDGNTKDSPTGLKNRNAYDVDLNNLIAKGHDENIGIIIGDINGLKQVNDRLGHQSGDSYINLVAEVFQDTQGKNMVSYRTGGDEFVVLVQDATDESLKKFVEIASSKVKSQKKFHDMRCSVACGYCIFDKNTDKDLNDTFKRADKFMYQEKQRQKEAEER